MPRCVIGFQKNGGEGGIRTHGTITGTAVFKTAAFNRSATSPYSNNILTRPFSNHSARQNSARNYRIHTLSMPIFALKPIYNSDSGNIGSCGAGPLRP